MKALPLSLCCLAGAMMASAGIIADALDTARRYDPPLYGGIIVVITLILTIVVTFTGDPRR